MSATKDFMRGIVSCVSIGTLEWPEREPLVSDQDAIQGDWKAVVADMFGGGKLYEQE